MELETLKSSSHALSLQRMQESQRTPFTSSEQIAQKNIFCCCFYSKHFGFPMIKLEPLAGVIQRQMVGKFRPFDQSVDASKNNSSQIKIWNVFFDNFQIRVSEILGTNTHICTCKETHFCTARKWVRDNRAHFYKITNDTHHWYTPANNTTHWHLTHILHTGK